MKLLKFWVYYYSDNGLVDKIKNIIKNVEVYEWANEKADGWELADHTKYYFYGFVSDGEKVLNDLLNNDIKVEYTIMFDENCYDDKNYNNDIYDDYH